MATTTTVIIGGGIAGLYAAWRLCDGGDDDNQRIIVLEKNGVLGGRAGTQTFAGTTILTGAGVGRKAKDHRLTALLHDLHVPYHTFEARQQYSPAMSQVSDSRIAAFVKRCFVELKREFRHRPSHVAFREFARVILGAEVYEKFVMASGYSDYEGADAEDVLYRYGFDDNFTTWTGMGISWKDLVHTLATRLRDRRVQIHTSTEVTRIQRHDDDGTVSVFSHNLARVPVLQKLHGPPQSPVLHNRRHPMIICNRVILATTVEVVQKLLPEISLYQHIVGQPFLRIYGRFSKSCRDVMREKVATTTIVPGPLHKLIPIRNDVYMIAYTDNADAKRVEQALKTSSSTLPTMCRLLERALDLPTGSLKLDDMVVIPWEIGTHFFKKLPVGFSSRRAFVKAAQRPYPNITVVGEMVSFNHQGWVEGCLESVETGGVPPGPRSARFVK
jgi:hypothetical protein